MTPHSGKFVAYYRVSTQRQGQSGLGLEAQQETVRQHLNGGDWELVGEFTEIESGRKVMRDRPELQKAIDVCKAEGATLVAAKIDRITRNLGFLTRILDSNVDIIFCDIPQMMNPAQNKFILQLMANVAEYESNIIGSRTKDALAAAKARGVKLGTRDPKKISKLASKERIAKADKFALEVGPIIEELQKYGCETLQQIANGLMARGQKTARQQAAENSIAQSQEEDKKYEWHPSNVKNVITRYEKLIGRKIK